MINANRLVFSLLGWLFVLFLFSCVLVACGQRAAGSDAVAVVSATVVATEPIFITADPTPTSPPAVNLDIKGFLFRPKTLTVTVGTEVIWTNLDDIQHSVTNGTPDTIGGAFDSGFFVQNEKFTFTFTEPGDYAYYCRRHPHMQAVIYVEAPQE